MFSSFIHFTAYNILIFWAGGVAQAVKCLSNLPTLSSNSSVTKKKKKQKNYIEAGDMAQAVDLLFSKLNSKF
jgi:hypothetical protein